MSTSGGSSDVGGTTGSVGVFDTLLLTINPALDTDEYPTDWTQFSITVSGVGAPTTGRFAFRYFVTDTNVHADYIGIDTVEVNPNSTPPPVPEPAVLPLLVLGLTAVIWVHRSRLVS
jgi:hypothetical protein